MTASKLRLACIGLLSVLAASGAWAAANGARPAAVDRTIRVNCDHGGDLQAALRRAGAGPATIHVIGTCVGQFETAGDRIEIIGRSPTESRIGLIEGGASPGALQVRGPGTVTVRNLEMFGSAYGLYVEGPGRLVIVEDCEITDNGYGVAALHGAHVALLNTNVISTHQAGLMANIGSVLTVIGGSIRGTSQGVSLFDRSTLVLRDTELRGNQVGLYGQGLCTIDATRTTFLDNGIHATVADRSALTLVDSTLGPQGDGMGPFSLYTGGDSRTTIVFTAPPGKVYGTPWVGGGSNLFVQGGTLHNGASLEDFSWAKFTDATVEGTIYCQTGSDAICAGSTSASVSGCGPVSSSCTGTPVPASEPPAFLKVVPDGGIAPPRWPAPRQLVHLKLD